jgi:predicted SprT family Zn-dependent metalloprotease
MKKELPITHPVQIGVSDYVKFFNRNREYFGYVCKKGRKYAYIVCNDTSEFRVPYQRLYKICGAVKRQVLSHTDKLRIKFHVNDKVSFNFNDQALCGVITRLNPKRAHILGENEKEYQVPYALLTLLSSDLAMNATRKNRNEMELAAVAQLAQELLFRYQLDDWSFQFDYGTKRAGCCRYDNHVISLAYDFAKHASDAEIKDAILHEIAHALVGKEHHHDAVWKAKAVEIGCSGDRCHDFRFTPPRYIVKCENNCWVATAERRRRGRVCGQCHGKLIYTTYTEKRWFREREHVSAEKRSKDI